MEKVDSQIIRFKDKLKDHKHRIKGLSPIIEQNKLDEEEDIDEVEAKSEPKLIKIRKFASKPMTIQEAMMQLGLLEDNFLVFSNSQTNQVNVIYKQQDGNYGWIEPEF